jgi:hypothetical protein
VEKGSAPAVRRGIIHRLLTITERTVGIFAAPAQIHPGFPDRPDRIAGGA